MQNKWAFHFLDYIHNSKLYLLQNSHKFLEFDNFVSNEEKNLPLDKNRFIDFKKMEENGEI